MFKRLLTFVGLLVYGTATLVVSGCGDDVRTTKSVTRHEQEPVEMVSPGTEIVE